MKKKGLFACLLFSIFLFTAACGKGTDVREGAAGGKGTEAENPEAGGTEGSSGESAQSGGNAESNAADSGEEKCIQEGMVTFDDSMGDEADVVLLMDESGSMAYSDTEGIAVEAAQLFIDMEKVSGVNISLIEFSNEIKATDLKEMEKISDKHFFGEILGKITYGGTAHTDTGAALKKAMEILNASDSAGKKAILLFTDGRTDIDDGTPGRTTEASLAEVDEVTAEAAERGYSIYAVGLNADGSVDEGALASLSSNTGGAYLIAKDVKELPAFFNRIFMEMMSIREKTLKEFDGDDEFHDVDIRIDSSHVLEANIVILSSNKVEHHLFNRQGDKVEADDEKLMISSKEKYTILKLIRPQEDEWTLKVKGVTGDRIQVSLLYNYDMSMVTELPSSNVRIGESLPVYVYLSVSGTPIEDAAFYDTVHVEATVKNAESGEETPIEFTASEKGMHGLFTPDAVGDYSLDIYLEGDGFYRNGESIALKAVPIGLTSPEDVPVLEIRKGQEISVDPGEYITGQQDIKYNAVNVPDIVECESGEEGDAFVIRGMKAGEAVLEVEAVGEADGSTAVVPIRIRCLEEEKTAPGLWLPGGIAAIIALLAAGIVIAAMKKGRKKIQGMFMLEVYSNLKGESGTMEKRSYSIHTPIQGRNLNTAKLPLEELLENYRKTYNKVERNDGKKKELDGILSSAAPYTKKVLIKGGKQDGQISVESKAANAVELYSMQGIRLGDKAEIGAGAPNGRGYQRSQGCKVRIKTADGYVEIGITYK